MSEINCILFSLWNTHGNCDHFRHNLLPDYSPIQSQRNVGDPVSAMPKRKKTDLTLVIKHEILLDLSAGVRPKEISNKFGVARSTLYLIKKNKSDIERDINNSHGVSNYVCLLFNLKLKHDQKLIHIYSTLANQKEENHSFSGVKQSIVYLVHYETKRSENVAVSGQILLEKANEFAGKLSSTSQCQLLNFTISMS